MEDLDINKVVCELAESQMVNLYDKSKSIKKDIIREFKLKCKTTYKTYIEKSVDKQSHIKSFFIRDSSVNIYNFFIPLDVKKN